MMSLRKKLNPIEQKLTKWLSPIRENLPDLYLVGGAVRDHLLNREIMDVDIACARPAEMATLLKRYHDVAVVLFDKKQNAVCYRVIDRHNKEDFLDIVQLRNNSILEDLPARDFTFNSIAIPIKKGGRIQELIDPLHGAADINNRRIKMSSANAFQSDPLRILRAFRFSAELNFSLDALTAKMLQKQVSLISSVSIERIILELLKIFKTKCSAHHVRDMDKAGLLEILFPEIKNLKGCKQNDHHHLDVWDHSLMVLENSEQICSNLHSYFPEFAPQIQKYLDQNNHLALTKMAALLHDIGKPDTRKTDENTNKVMFYGHDQAGRKIISDVSKKIKLSTRDQLFLESMVGEHMHVLFLSRPDVKEKTMLKWLRKLGDNSIPLIILGMADRKSTLGKLSSQTALAHYLTWSRNLIQHYFREIKPTLAQASFINGKDLLAIGMSPGPDLGRILTAVREAQDLGKIQNYQEGLALAQKMIANGNPF